jgi:toxin ParE1/3/4
VKIVVHPEAAAELAAAVAWYEDREEGLGDELERDVYDAFDVIAENPNAWPTWPRLKRVRVFPLDRFPYLIPYAPGRQTLFMLAVAHAKRNPGYWRYRLLGE